MTTRIRAYNLTRHTCVASEVEVASTVVRRAVGLLGRHGLPPGHGLLLRPCSGIHTCFMRFPIDAVFLDSKGRVVRVVEGLPPFRFVPYVRGAAAVLELPAGAVRESRTVADDRIAFLKGAEPLDT